MEYKSEIRNSLVNQLVEKVQKGNYGKYLPKIKIVKARAISNQTVTFDFPVTAIVGPNGGGKSTILGAAALAYRAIKPRLFFAKSGNIDNSMVDWKIEYRIIDREIKTDDTIGRTAGFRRQKWNRTPVDRDILFFGVTRTVPAAERKELLRCSTNTFRPKAEMTEEFSQEVISAVGRILDKDVSFYRKIKVDNKGRVTLLSGRTADGNDYSEFHFGAGESSIIRMILDIESLPDNSLILIEEIENGLHPVATCKMVEYLIELGKRKKTQAIFTTHSNDALLPLPPKAIWVAVDGKLVQGKPDIRSLRAITGTTGERLVVFAEDEFACDWVKTAMRNRGKIPLESVGIYSMRGDGTAVKVNSIHNLDPSVAVPSVCFIDGDSMQEESDENKVFRLPGESPEQYIFDCVYEVLDTHSGKLAVALLQDYADESKLKDILEGVQRQTIDPHLLFAHVGEALGLIPQQRVVEAFLTIWAQAYQENVLEIVQRLEGIVPE